MTFRQGGSFMESETMRELERQAIRRGHYDSDEVEVAASKVAKVSYKPTEDLYVDLLKLASGLREKGFVSQADEIEKNAFLYKQAETHLYRVHDEDGADILGFAHPDGEAHVFDAQIGLGDFETLLSAQEKMLAVVRKQPMSKMASLASLVKEAAVDLGKIIEKKDQAIVDLRLDDEELYKWHVANIMRLPNDSLGIKLYAAATGLEKADIDFVKNIVAKIYGNEPFDFLAIENFIRSKQITRDEQSDNAVVKQLVDFGNAINPGDGSKYFTGSQGGVTKALSYEYDSILKPENQNSIWKIEALTGNYVQDANKVRSVAQYLHNIIKTKYDTVFSAEQIGKADEYVRQNFLSKVGPLVSASDEKDIASIVYKLISDKVFNVIGSVFNVSGFKAFKSAITEINTELTAPPDWWKPEITSWRFAQIAKIIRENEPGNEAVANEFDGLARAVGTTVKPLAELLKAVHPYFRKATDFYSIDKLSKDKLAAYQKAYPNSKQSSYFADLIKNADVSDTVPTNAKPAQAPAGGQKPTAGKPTAGRPTVEEKQAVALMQRKLSDLASNLAAKAETLKLAGITPEQIAADSKIIGYTQQDVRGEGPLDGKWGKNTIAALTTLQKYLTAVGMPTNAIVIGTHYLSAQPAAVVANANRNIGALNELLEKLGFPTSDKPAGATAYDKIPKTLDIPSKSWSPAVGGEVAITSGDMGSLQDLYLYMTQHEISTQAFVKDELEKLADKFAQALPQLQMGQEVYDPWATKTPAVPATGLTVSQMETALKWLVYRSNRKAAAAPNDPVTQQYYARAQMLYRQFQAWKAGPGRDKDLNSVINPDDFVGGGFASGRGGEVGAGKPAGRGGRGSSSGVDVGEDDSDEERDLEDRAKPPFKSTNYPLNIASLLERYGLDSGWFNQNLATNFITRQMLYNPSSSWQQIMSQDAISDLKQARDSGGDPMAAHPGGWFREFAEQSIQALHAIFNAWYRNAPSTESIANQQVQYMNQWVAAFTKAEDTLNGWMRNAPASKPTAPAPSGRMSITDQMSALRRNPNLSRLRG